MEENKLLQMFEAVMALHDREMGMSVREALKYKEDELKSEANSYQSCNISDLAAAFFKAQGEFPSVGFNRDNTFFKSGYADLDAIIRTVKPSLFKNQLSLFQFTRIGEGGEIILHTRLLHATGQWIETRSRIIPEKGDHQSYGKAVSYHRRYAIMTLLGITASNDPSDDDAEGLMEKHRDLSPSSASHKYQPDKQSASTVTKEQLEELNYELQGLPDLAEKFLMSYKIQELCDLPKSIFIEAINKIRTHKAMLGNKNK